MNYELAKKLKEAGFPMKRIQRGDTHGHYWREVFTTPDEKSYLIPTLSELIEACGENIKSIDFLHDINLVIAFGFPEKGEGITIVEAVSKLWLALNKKQNL